MNIYREVVNRIEIPALPSLESGYYLLRFERNGTASNVYAVVENESGMGVPITASITEIGTGTPDPTDGEVLLAPGAWTLFFYEQVSGTNTNPDCSTIPLGQTEVTVYGEDAAVLSQTPTTCPSGPVPLVYKALLTQVDTDPPTAIILFNTIGSVVWTYIGPGLYRGTLTGAFPQGRTAPSIANTTGDGISAIPSITRISADAIAVQTGDISGGGVSQVDNELFDTLITIEVYPT